MTKIPRKIWSFRKRWTYFVLQGNHCISYIKITFTWEQLIWYSSFRLVPNNICKKKKKTSFFNIQIEHTIKFIIKLELKRSPTIPSLTYKEFHLWDHQKTVMCLFFCHPSMFAWLVICPFFSKSRLGQTCSSQEQCYNGDIWMIFIFHYPASIDQSVSFYNSSY
jgi:hypothetical protein